MELDFSAYADPSTWWSKQDEIMKALADQLKSRTTQDWLTILDAADIWCAPVLSLPELVAHEGFQELDMVQKTQRISGDGNSSVEITTTRSPMRFDGRTLNSKKGAPHVGQHTEEIRAEFMGETK